MEKIESTDYRISRKLLIIHTALVAVPVLVLLGILAMSVQSWELYGKNDPAQYHANVNGALSGLALFAVPTIVAWILLVALRYRVKRQWWIPAGAAAFAFLTILITFLIPLLGSLLSARPL